MSLGAPELLIVLIIVFLLFGATRLPKLARSLGEASKEFKEGVAQGGSDDVTPEPRPDDKITMTHAELEALMAEREARARGDAPPTI